MLKSLIEFESCILAAAQSIHSPALDAVMLFFTYLGNWQIIGIELVLACILLASKKYWTYIAALLFSIGGGEVIIWLLKHAVGRVRPFFAATLVSENDFSFPSGHAFISVVFYGLIAYFLFNKSAKFKRLMAAATVFFLALIIGLSRIYVGVHWLSDVLAGWIIGKIWLAISVKILEKMPK